MKEEVRIIRGITTTIFWNLRKTEPELTPPVAVITISHGSLTMLIKQSYLIRYTIMQTDNLM